MTRTNEHQQERPTKLGYVGVPVEFTPRKAPRVPIRSVVACPECEAVLDQPCVSRTGKEIASTHRSRRRLAVRKQNEDRGV